MSPVPAVMVSSTFYDLRQIRNDLARFISEQLGYTPLLSEFPSFPVDPDNSTIENCCRRVERDASIFVLIIGGRYGSVDDRSDKSITNLEYLTARKKGIPVYAFVSKGIRAVVPLWRQNPMANFSSVVDTPRLFEFFEQVQSADRIWTFEFDTAQDIISALRTQFAYLFENSLRLRARLAGKGLPQHFEAAGPKTLQIWLEQPRGWEYLLLFQSWVDEVERRADRLREYDANLAFGRSEHVAAREAAEWMQTRLHELVAFNDAANQLINKSMNEAVGPPGMPGSAEKIIWATTMLGKLLDETMLWARSIRCARVEPPMDKAARELSAFADDLIQQMREFPSDSLKQVEEHLALPVDPAGPRTLNLQMKLRLSNIDGFQHAMSKAVDSLGLG